MIGHLKRGHAAYSGYSSYRDRKLMNGESVFKYEYILNDTTYYEYRVYILSVLPLVPCADLSPGFFQVLMITL